MVGSFRIQRLLGRGGMGTVYLAEHPVIGSRVAVKFLHESMCGSPELVGRFYDEARAVNLIGHQNIVAIYDLAQLPPARYYIVMEYLEGAPLSERLRTGRLPLPTVLDVLLQLADALGAAHDHGVIHRDLKPENVFLLERRGTSGFVKLVDFGIAKLADRQSGAGRTAAGVLVGTPEYMAPEQCQHGRVDRRTDVYALGVMAYELATGRLPFTGEGVAQLLLAQVTQQPSPPRAVDPSVPEPLERAILTALAKDPAKRFQDMAAFGAALEAARAAPAGQASAPAAAPAPAPPPPPAAAAPQAEERRLEVRWAGGAPRGLRILQATRGGISFALDGPPPALRAQVVLALPGAAGRAVEVVGEVVRHISRADAERWGVPPGFAVQLGPLDAAQRRAVDALTEPPRPAPAGAAAAAGSASGEAPAAALERLEARAQHGPYELLGLRHDAGFAEVRAGARAVRAEVEALRGRLGDARQLARVTELLTRIAAALDLLGTPGERLLFDARRGNFQGVAHCVTAGATAALVEARRRALLAELPGRAAEAQRQLARARVAEKLDNAPAALTAYEAALAADPLDLEVHRAYWALRRRSGPGAAG